MNAPASIQEQLATLKAAWMFVGAYAHNSGPLCEECPFNYVGGQMHPYGEGQAFEAYSECRLGDRLSDKPSMCPAWREQQEQMCSTT